VTFRPVTFGYFPVPNAAEAGDVVHRAVLAEELGFDLIAIQDHPYQRRFLDTWTLLAWIAARTERIGVFPDVANLPLRHPAVLAKSAASLDVLSGGRVELGLGAGGFWDAIEAMGGPRRSPGEALAALEEAIAVIRAMWSGQRGLKVEGRHYRLSGAHSGPAPVHPIGIWIGGYGPRMLELIGRVADGWVPSLPYVGEARLPSMRARLEDAAAAAGRDPAAIRRVLNVGGRIADERGEQGLVGPPSMWVETLRRLALEHGFDTFVLWAEGDEDEQMRRFAGEVAPAVLEAVAAEHG
jgi:alkanesulfonate monooxygenase SsuD/methylene tetrahydromethanopterin reductase-like flavin-dependent oxidoreductase (luciferase family)